MKSPDDWAQSDWCDLTRHVISSTSSALHDSVSRHLNLTAEHRPIGARVEDAKGALARTAQSAGTSSVTSWVCNVPEPNMPVPMASSAQVPKRPRDDDELKVSPFSIRPAASSSLAPPHVPPAARSTPVPHSDATSRVLPPPPTLSLRAPLQPAAPLPPWQQKVQAPPPPLVPASPIMPPNIGTFGQPRALGLRAVQDSAAATAATAATVGPQKSSAYRNPLQAPADSGEAPPVGFVTAAQQLDTDIKRGRCPPGIAASLQNKPSLGLRRPYTAPLHTPCAGNQPDAPAAAAPGGIGVGRVLSSTVNPKQQQSKSGNGDGGAEHDPADYPPQLLLPDGSVPPILLPLDPKLVTQITYEILEKQCNVDWSDIAGLEFAKSSVEEAIVWPLRRPDLFVGLRDPPRGLLLFGPPGTGKTMIARAIASRAECTFLNISSSSLMSKWVGDGEKMVRCMFAVAVLLQPSVIFIDEIDSLLSMRGEGEQDGVRRVKTEFLVQLDGVGTSASDRVLLIGATNRPEELDEAARRRMEKRLYIPLPDEQARKDLCQTLLSKGNFVHSIGDAELLEIAKLTDGFSGADLKGLCREAAMGPLRSNKTSLSELNAADIRPVMLKDFKGASRRIKPSVGQSELERYVKWNDQFGSFTDHEHDEEDDDD